MKLEQLLKNIEYSELHGKTDAEVKSVEFDSRKVQNGAVFVAQRGTQTDGHRFISAAVQNGAIAVICEALPAEMTEGVTFVKVPDAAKATGLLASAFHDFPSRKMKVIGVTGTN